MDRVVRKQGARFAAMACVLIVGLMPLRAHADGAKAAAAMAQQAIRAYESGDHVRAAQLYVNAWRTDPKTPAYLYAAARAEHAGDQLERAEAHYREFIAVAGADVAMVAKANGFLKDLREGQAGTMERDADRAARSENWKLAAQLYLDAHELAPDRATLLFRAAMANESLGDFGLAESQFRAYLATSDPNAKGRKEAQIHLDQLERKLHAKQDVPRPAPPPEPTVVAKPAPPPAQSVVATRAAPVTSIVAPGPADGAQSRLPEWSSLGGGAALGIAAGVLYAMAGGQRSDLATALATKDASGQIVGTSRTAALQERSSIESKEMTAYVLGGAGVAAIGAGVWLWLRHSPGNVAVVPGPGDIGIAIALHR